MTEATLSDKQVLSIHQATGRVNIWHGAVRSGKSVGADFCWLNFIRNAPPTGELVMMGRTKETITRNVINVLKEPSIFGPLARTVAYTDGANTAVILGRQVHILGANDVQSEAKVRGMTVAGALVDEASILPQTTFQQLVARMSVRGAKLFATTNPDSPNHWLLTDWINKRDPDTRVFHFEIDDNPFLDPAFVAYLKRQYTGLWYQRFILGKWVLAEGAVFDMFDRRRHVIHPARIPAIETWVATGVDYGTSNPFHAVAIGAGIDRRLYVVSEYRHDSRKAQRQLTDAEYSHAYRTWLGTQVPVPQTSGFGAVPRYHVVDPSATSFRVQLMRDGVSSWPARNEVLDGIRTVSQLLAADQLMFASTAVATIDEMQGYSWDSTAQAKGEDKPMKINDHGADAVRYGTHTTEPVWRTLIGQTAPSNW